MHSAKLDLKSDLNSKPTNDFQEKNNDKIKVKLYEKKIIIVLGYVLSFFIPAILLYFIYGSMNIGFGFNKPNTVLTSDMQGQYMPFIAGIRYLFENPYSVLFNWNYSLGGNYLGVVAYYLCSPLNVITLFFDISHMPDAIFLLQLLKTGFCGLSFYIYLQKKYRKTCFAPKDLLFALCYALMSYAVVYALCTMWIDAVILLPLIILGVDYLLEEKRNVLYCVLMALALITNYYTAYMLGIFASLYVCAFVAARWEKGKTKASFDILTQFGIQSVIAIGVSMPSVLPAVMNAKYRYIGGTLLEDEGNVYHFSAWDFLRKFLPSQYDTIFSDGGRPYIYCGSIILIFAILYFFQKHEVKEKLASAFLLLILLFGFLFGKVDYIWHGFRYPHSFPYRYAFLFSFMLLVLAYQSLQSIKLGNSTYRLLLSIFMFYTVLEVYMNGTAIIGGIVQEIRYDVRAEYDFQDEVYGYLADIIRKDQGFYRMGNQIGEDEGNINASTMYGLHGVDYFSSSSNNGIALFFENLGSMDVAAYICSRGLTPVADSLMGIKYRVARSDEFGLYDETAEIRTYKLLENTNVLSIGYMIPNSDTDIKFSENVFENQNQLLRYYGIEDSEVFQPVSADYIEIHENGLNGWQADFECASDQVIYYYLDCDLNYDAQVVFTLDGEVINNTYQRNTKRIYTLQDVEAGLTHSLRVYGNMDSMTKLYIYVMDVEKYNQAISQLKKQELINYSENGKSLSGDVNVVQDGIMLFTLAYEDGYRIYVDGKQVPYKKIVDTFIGVDLNSGLHHIEIVYTPPGLMTGMLICLFMVIFFSVYYIIIPRFTKTKNE